ncbi:MAG: DUF86 domain-containing protein [Chloroflexi bacterium]|nr:DUF86 domain-containing protein [Chloroflexota bacterium]
MPSVERDAAYLWDMLDLARSACEFAAAVRLETYQRDRKLQLAVERTVEIIGEAARRVSEEFRNGYPEIPWRGMIAQRNVLAHEYGEIKQERMWLLVTDTCRR